MLSVPGRLNLIGEHVDYHDIPVLPIAIQRRIAFAFQPREDKEVSGISRDQPHAVCASLGAPFTSGSPGDWGNYVRAAGEAMRKHFGIARGINLYVASDLPSAAGLSSSSALLTGVCLALLRVNGLKPDVHELAAVLPDAEQLVGTRGGAMDHVAILASRGGYATLIRRFEPLEVEYVAIPVNWRFLAAHSLVTAEKSNAHREAYNAIRSAGARALEKLGLASYREAMAEARDISALENMPEGDAYVHVISEARRVLDAVRALRSEDATAFGKLLDESHASLRDRLRVSVPALDELVECARAAGAFGARMTGAGFGGCVVCLCTEQNVAAVEEALVRSFYVRRPEFDRAKHLFIAEPSAGVLSPEAADDADEHSARDTRHHQ